MNLRSFQGLHLRLIRQGCPEILVQQNPGLVNSKAGAHRCPFLPFHLDSPCLLRVIATVSPSGWAHTFLHSGPLGTYLNQVPTTYLFPSATPPPQNHCRPYCCLSFLFPVSAQLDLWGTLLSPLGTLPVQDPCAMCNGLSHHSKYTRSSMSSDSRQGRSA